MFGAQELSLSVSQGDPVEQAVAPSHREQAQQAEFVYHGYSH